MSVKESDNPENLRFIASDTGVNETFNSSSGKNAKSYLCVLPFTKQVRARGVADTAANGRVD